MSYRSDSCKFLLFGKPFSLVLSLLDLDSKCDIFTGLSIFDSPKASSVSFKTCKNITMHFNRTHPIIVASVQKFRIQHPVSLLPVQLDNLSIEHMRLSRALGLSI